MFTRYGKANNFVPFSNVNPTSTTPIVEPNTLLNRYNNEAAPVDLSHLYDSPITTPIQVSNTTGTYKPYGQTNKIAPASFNDYTKAINSNILKPDFSNIINRKTLIPNYGQGNIDLNNRPVINNPDGSKSTVYSMTFTNDDGSSVLVPGVRQGLDRQMTPDEAYAWYQKTGENLGKFKSEDLANKYADTLHEDQSNQYVPTSTNKITAPDNRAPIIKTQEDLNNYYEANNPIYKLQKERGFLGGISGMFDPNLQKQSAAFEAQYKTLQDQLNAKKAQDAGAGTVQEEEAKRGLLGKLADKTYSTIGNAMMGGQDGYKDQYGRTITSDNVDLGGPANFATGLIGTGIGLTLNPGGSNVQGGAMNGFGNLSENLAGKTVSKAPTIVQKFVPAMVKSGAEFGALGGMSSAQQGQSNLDIAKNAGLSGLQGMAFGGLTKGLGLGANGIKSKFNNSLGDTLNTLDQIKKPSDLTASDKITTPTLSSNKFTVKNTNIGKGEQNYSDFVTGIQNEYGHYKLTPEEIATYSKKIGVDPIKLAEAIGNDKAPNITQLGNNLRLAQTAGAKDIKNVPLTNPLINKPYNNIDLKANDTLKPNLGTNTPLENNSLKPPLNATPSTKLTMDIVSSDKGNKTSLKDKLSNAYTAMIDKNNSLNKFSKAAKDETYIKATNTANVSTTVNHIMDKGLVDRNGLPLDVSYKSLVDSLPKDRNDFSNYLLQLHNIDRAREGKPVDPKYTSDESAAAVKEILKNHPEYKAQGEKATGWINKFMSEWGNKSGLINDDLWKSLNTTYKNYLPTNRDFTDIEGVNPRTAGKGFVDQSMPINKATGSSRDITDPFESVMNVINRTVRTAKYNEVGQSMLESIKKNPEAMKKFGEIIPEGESIPKTNDIVTVLDKGEKVNIKINDKELIKNLEGIGKVQDTPIQDALRKVTQPYKDLITTKNPLFTVRNMSRDLATAYVNGSEHNPLKFGKNYLGALKDVATNSDIAKQYNALGGGGSNFDFNSQNTTKSLNGLVKKPNIFQKISGGIEKVNNAVETAPRLSEFKTTLAKGGSLDRALYNSGEITTNFSRGGKIAKTIDSGVPYFNASLQGLDKTIRQFKSNPIGTLAKGIVSVTIPALALNAINGNNPNYQELDNRTKDNYYLFPDPTNKDENGVSKTFIKIPKSREIGVLFGSLAERTLRLAQGQNDSFKGFGNTIVTNVAPTNPLENNMVTPFITNLPSNKDFAGRTIVPQAMQSRSPNLQYDETTSEIGKKIGELANLSPKQVDYIIRSYTGVLGQVGLPASTKQTYLGNTKGTLLKPVTTSFTADPLYSNQNITDFYDNLDKAKQQAADKNFTGNIPSKDVTYEESISSQLNKINTTMSDLSKQATKATQAGDQEQVNKIRQQMIDSAKQANKIWDSRQ